MGRIVVMLLLYLTQLPTAVIIAVSCINALSYAIR